MILTKNQLARYVRLGRELRLIEAQLTQMPNVTDTVQASGNEYPYLLHKVTISGMDTKRILRLQYRRKYLKKQQKQIEDFINSLYDAYMRNVLWARYIVGASWVQIGHMMGVPFEGVQKASNRYLKRVCKP